VVEVQVSFVVTPTGQSKRKMRTILRSIALIDGKFAQVRTDHFWKKRRELMRCQMQDANKRRIQGAVRPQQKPPTLRLKRKIGYDIETDSEEGSSKQKKRVEDSPIDMITETF
jgi:hypothetical protein